MHIHIYFSADVRRRSSTIRGHNRETRVSGCPVCLPQSIARKSRDNPRTRRDMDACERALVLPFRNYIMYMHESRTVTGRTVGCLAVGGGGRGGTCAKRQSHTARYLLPVSSSSCSSSSSSRLYDKYIKQPISVFCPRASRSSHRSIIPVIGSRDYYISNVFLRLC